MDLFTVQNSIAVPSTHALLIEPFRTLWNRDQTQHKEVAIREFTYIELLCSYKKSNPYSGYKDDLKKIKVANNVFPDIPDYVPDLIVEECIKMYNSLQEESSPSLRLIKAAEKAINEVESFLTTVDLTERTNSGAAVLKPVDVANAVKQLPEMSTALVRMKEKVQQELNDNSKTRGQREIGYFED